MKNTGETNYLLGILFNIKCSPPFPGVILETQPLLYPPNPPSLLDPKGKPSIIALDIEKNTKILGIILSYILVPDKGVPKWDKIVI